MTFKLTRSLWLWAGFLALALLGVLPPQGWIRAVAMLAVVALVGWAWRRAGRRQARQGEQWLLADKVAFPPGSYRKPVVLVCGDGLAGLFGATPVGQLALRTTAQGCYVRVPALDQLVTLTCGIQALRPNWAGQLSVMFAVNPGEHTDSAQLAGRIRAFCNQVALVRKRGIALPLMLVSYLQGAKGEGTWFSWEAGQPSLLVREANACTRLPDWQREAGDNATGAARLCSGVQVCSAASWLSETVAAHFKDGPPLVCAISLAPVLTEALDGNLWQQWLRAKAALIDATPAETSAALPFPDPLLNLLPLHTGRPAVLRAGATAGWMFAVAGLIAMLNSAWQNTFLLRQITDDLRRYTAIPATDRSDQPQLALRENAVAVLRQEAQRLDSYYRHGEPLSLGMGLYRGERLRLPLLTTIANHRQPPAAPPSAESPFPVRLDSLSLFGTGSAQLKPGSTKVLISALVNIKAQPGWLIVIAGHTDATGNPAHNLELSRSRAASVRDWMRRMGDIPDSCFAVQGFGADQPMASNDTEEGRAANRRVDIRLVPEAGACSAPVTVSDRHTVPHPAAVKF